MMRDNPTAQHVPASPASPVSAVTLDHHLHPTSRIQSLMTLCFLGISVGLVGINMATDAQLQSWRFELVGLLMLWVVVGVGLWRHQRQAKPCCYVALATHANEQSDTDSMLMQDWWHWQLGFSHQHKTGHKTGASADDRPADFELWEARLLTAQDLGWCVCLRFAVSHPISGNKALVIWRDQVSQPVWRSLKIIANWAD